MTRFVVFREFRGVMVWYVEADDERAAIERVWPEDPTRDPAFVDSGGMEAPHLEAHLEAGPPRVRRVRRFPRRVEICFGDTRRRWSGQQGER